MRPRDLVVTARKLLRKGQKGPMRQSDLKRALSTAYYAMFHALCWNCSDSFIGKTKSSRSQPAWRQAYRAVDHGFAKNQCKNGAIMVRFPQEFQDFANKFVELQERRHAADYDPFSKFTRRGVYTAIDAADAAIKELEASANKDKRAFAAWTVMKNR